jgi:hypothetical protein
MIKGRSCDRPVATLGLSSIMPAGQAPSNVKSPDFAQEGRLHRVRMLRVGRVAL